MEILLGFFLAGFLLGTMVLHMNFWADFGKSAHSDASILGWVSLKEFEV